MMKKALILVWLLYFLGSLLWYLGQPRSAGCDGGLCLVGPALLVSSWVVAAVVLGMPYVVFETIKSVGDWFNKRG
jgi:hypothetical protein